MAVQTDGYTTGKEYIKLSSPVPVSQLGKIEMVELSRHGCSHCYTFEPTVVPWSEKLPTDAHFVRLLALLDDIWNVHGQMFPTLESMGVEYDVRNVVFKMVHKGHRKFAIPEEMVDFLAGRGVDKEKFLSAHNSFTTKGRMEKAKKLAMAYQVTGAPTMMVGDKYYPDIGSAGGSEETFKLADCLTKEERATAKK